MSSIIKIPDEDAHRLLSRFQELLQTLPPGTAELALKRTTNVDGTIVWLKPAKKHAAGFSAHVEDANNSLIDVSFGVATTFDLPVESSLPNNASFDMMLEKLRTMGSAIIAGSISVSWVFVARSSWVRTM